MATMPSQVKAKYGPPRTPLAPHKLAKIANAFGLASPLPNADTFASYPYSQGSGSTAGGRANQGSKYLLHVIPPSHLPHDDNYSYSDPYQIEDDDSYGSTGGQSFKRGRLVPLQSTLHSQLGAIAREYGLPSTGGMTLFLVTSTPASNSNTNGRGRNTPNWNSSKPTNSGPRITDHIWNTLWSRVLRAEREDSVSRLTPSPFPGGRAYTPTLRSHTPLHMHSTNGMGIATPTSSRSRSPAPTPSPMSANGLSMGMTNDSPPPVPPLPRGLSGLGFAGLSTPHLPLTGGFAGTDMHPTTSQGSPSEYDPSEEFMNAAFPASSPSGGSLLPIIATVEFDIDRRRAAGAWYAPWRERRAAQFETMSNGPGSRVTSPVDEASNNLKALKLKNRMSEREKSMADEIARLKKVVERQSQILSNSKRSSRRSRPTAVGYAPLDDNEGDGMKEGATLVEEDYDNSEDAEDEDDYSDYSSGSDIEETEMLPGEESIMRRLNPPTSSSNRSQPTSFAKPSDDNDELTRNVDRYAERVFSDEEAMADIRSSRDPASPATTSTRTEIPPSHLPTGMSLDGLGLSGPIEEDTDITPSEREGEDVLRLWENNNRPRLDLNDRENEQGRNMHSRSPLSDGSSNGTVQPLVVHSASSPPLPNATLGHAHQHKKPPPLNLSLALPQKDTTAVNGLNTAIGSANNLSLPSSSSAVSTPGSVRLPYATSESEDDRTRQRPLKIDTVSATTKRRTMDEEAVSEVGRSMLDGDETWGNGASQEEPIVDTENEEMKKELDEIEKALQQFSPRAMSFEDASMSSAFRQAGMPSADTSLLSSEELLLGPPRSSSMVSGPSTGVPPVPPIPTRPIPAIEGQDAAPTFRPSDLIEAAPSPVHTNDLPRSIANDKDIPPLPPQTQTPEPPLKPQLHVLETPTVPRPQVSLNSPGYPISPDPFRKDAFDPGSGGGATTTPISQHQHVPSVSSQSPSTTPSKNTASSWTGTSRFSDYDGETSGSVTVTAPTSVSGRSRTNSIVSVKSFRKLWRKSGESSKAPPTPSLPNGAAQQSRDTTPPPPTPTIPNYPTSGSIQSLPTSSSGSAPQGQFSAAHLRQPPPRPPRPDSEGLDPFHFDQESRYPNLSRRAPSPQPLSSTPRMPVEETSVLPPTPTIASVQNANVPPNAKGSVKKSILKAWRTPSTTPADVIVAESQQKGGKRRPSVIESAKNMITRSSVGSTNTMLASIRSDSPDPNGQSRPQSPNENPSSAHSRTPSIASLLVGHKRRSSNALVNPALATMPSADDRLKANATPTPTSRAPSPSQMQRAPSPQSVLQPPVIPARPGAVNRLSSSPGPAWI